MKLNEYYELAAGPMSDLDPEEMESVAYARADLARASADAENRTSPAGRAVNWCRSAHRLRTIATELGRLPRLADDVPRDVLNWVTYQRRNMGRQNGFQVAFLESIPGWTWSPWDEEWDRRAAQLQLFLDEEGRPPSTRAHDVSERVLAKWVARQRQLHAKGDLLYARAKALQAILGPR